ncbi:MAG: glycosyltransferase family 4 protein [Thermoanaerobaculia bacterium]|nr:glycosyltransferase family 4 protein [Thermoanaerobaculia bacterium]
MRVAVVEPEARGGLIQYAYQLARGMASDGARVTLVTGRGPEIRDPDPSVRLVPLLELWDPKPGTEEGGTGGSALPRRLARGARYVREWVRLVRWLETQRFDVIQLGDLRFGIELPFLIRLRRSRALLSDICHNVIPFSVREGSFRSRPLIRLLYRWIYRLFDTVFVHFESNRERFLATYGLPEDRVRAIPMGEGSLFRELRDPELEASSLRESHDLPGSGPVILLFGTLSPYKGVDLLLEAFARISDRHPEARLVVAGYPLPGFDISEMRRRTEELGLSGRVRFLPRYLPAPEVGPWMEMVSVAVFPYRESFQSAAVQVPLAFEVPVVATDVGAMEEALAHGEAGVLVPSDDAEALAEALGNLLSRPEVAAELGRRGRRIAEERFSWERIGAMVCRRYRELLISGSRRKGGAA